ncbi:thioesterase family protein [Acidibrevibacterium fodinaquatile]|uniref:thioesterase family protein n=1 Tax=Acidibrevibacterium fodinaquatile TaxID=1969806 RepID=UPI000E0DEE20|nr:thioesterase family protein [Acidibrevibacterium fodinaquatile]
MTPAATHDDVVIADWIDRNGHLNLAYYLVLFDRATDVLFDRLGVGAAYSAASGCSLFVVETHTLYERELALGAQVRIDCHVLGADEKRLHLAHEMFRAGEADRVALLEGMVLHVDLGSRRTAPFPAAIAATLAGVVTAAPPAGLGRRISGLGRR